MAWVLASTMRAMTEAEKDRQAGLNLVVTAAWLAWLAVVAGIAWLTVVKAPRVEALLAETDLAVPLITTWALAALDWARAHWQVATVVAVLPLIALLLLRRLVVAVAAVGMIFAAGMVAGGLAVALWLPERTITRLRDEVRPPPPSPAAVEVEDVDVE